MPLGGRFYCAPHRVEALRSIQFSWGRSGLVEIVALVGFVTLASLWGYGALVGHTAPDALPTTLLTGILLAFVPTAIWMRYVYRLDRLEPEPKWVVAGVGALGALLAMAVAVPVARQFFETQAWQHRSVLSEAVAMVMVDGVLQQLCTFAAVRFTVFLTDEFDDPIDGVVYATAAALGVVTVTNVDFVLSHQGVLPLEGATRLASHALVHVAAAAVLGYGMGRSRFASDHRVLGRGELWSVLGLVGSILVNGFAKLGATFAGIDGGDVSPWVMLSVSLVSALVVLLLVDRLILQLTREALTVGVVPAEDSDGVPGVGIMRMFPRWLGWSAAPVAVLGMAGAWAHVATSMSPPKSIQALDGLVSLTLPGGWTADMTEEGVFAQRPSLGEHTPEVHLEQMEVPSHMSEDLFVSVARAKRERSLATQHLGYRVLEVETVTLLGQEDATRAHYALVRLPPLDTPRALPWVVLGTDTYVPLRGRGVIRVITTQDAYSLEQTEEVERIVRSLDLVGVP